MKTIEDYLQIAFSLGKIAGAAETIEDENTRDSIYEKAQSLFDGTLEEALEEENLRKAEVRELQKRAVAEAVGISPAPVQKNTNFTELTRSPEALAEFLGEQPYCGRGEVIGDCDEKCIPCVLKWLNAEVAE